MKVTVTIDDEQFEVQIADLYARPIVAEVDGQRYEVWLNETPVARPVSSTPAAGTAIPAPSATARPAAAPAAPAADAPPAASSSRILAPIPGVIVAISVQPGDTVEPGQQVCILEAMKMKNIIRAPRSGTIGAIRVSPGQHVRHHDVLIEYAD